MFPYVVRKCSPDFLVKVIQWLTLSLPSKPLKSFLLDNVKDFIWYSRITFYIGHFDAIPVFFHTLNFQLFLFLYFDFSTAFLSWLWVHCIDQPWLSLRDLFVSLFSLKLPKAEELESFFFLNQMSFLVTLIKNKCEHIDLISYNVIHTDVILIPRYYLTLLGVYFHVPSFSCLFLVLQSTG